MARFKLSEYQVTSLQERAVRFAATVVSFCERMGYRGLKAVLAEFQVRSDADELLIRNASALWLPVYRELQV